MNPLSEKQEQEIAQASYQQYVASLSDENAAGQSFNDNWANATPDHDNYMSTIEEQQSSVEDFDE